MWKYFAIALLSTAATPNSRLYLLPVPALRKRRHRNRRSNLGDSSSLMNTYLPHPDLILLIDERRPDEIAMIDGFQVYLSIQINDLKNH